MITVRHLNQSGSLLCPIIIAIALAGRGAARAGAADFIPNTLQAETGGKPPVTFPGKRAVITTFGASPDHGRINTNEIQRAIDYCGIAGGGVVVVPAGTFVTGTLRLRSHVHLEIDSGAVLLGSPDLRDYPVQPTPSYRSLKDSTGFRALIYAENETDIGLEGHGTIDGQGAKFTYKGGEHPVGSQDMDGRPRLILFVSCENVCVEDLRLRNSGLWMQHYLNCDRVQIRGLDVWNHANHNNDMLDLDGCRRSTVSDCIGDTDDDGITLKSTGPAPCEDIVITNCVVSSRCSAIKCGTESTGGFRNIAISNCVIKPSSATNAFSGTSIGTAGIALEIVDGGVLDGVTISNIIIQGTSSPLFIRLGNRARKYRQGANTPPLGALRNVSIMNVIARNAGSTGCSITGIPGHPVENLSLSGIRIELAESGAGADVGRSLSERETSYPDALMWGRLPAYGFFLRHVDDVRFSNVVVTPHPGEPRPPFESVDAQGMQFYQCNFLANQSLSPTKK